MIRSSFLLALVVSSAQAVHVKLNSSEPKKSIKEGPYEGFPTDGCSANIPPHLEDAVCFDGEWIEFEWLNDPTFWECGKKPAEADSEYSICDPKTGKWIVPTQLDDLADQNVCGKIPDEKKYYVCNHA